MHEDDADNSKDLAVRVTVCILPASHVRQSQRAFFPETPNQSRIQWRLKADTGCLEKLAKIADGFERNQRDY